MRVSSNYKGRSVTPQTELTKDIDHIDNSLETRGMTRQVQRTTNVNEEGCNDMSQLSKETVLTLERCHGQPQPSTETALPSNNSHNVQKFSRESLLTSNNDNETNILTPNNRDSDIDDKQEGWSIPFIKDWFGDSKEKRKGIVGFDDTTCAVRIPCPNHFLLMYATASGKLVLVRLFF